MLMMPSATAFALDVVHRIMCIPMMVLAIMLVAMALWFVVVMLVAMAFAVAVTLAVMPVAMALAVALAVMPVAMALAVAVTFSVTPVAKAFAIALAVMFVAAVVVGTRTWATREEHTACAAHVLERLGCIFAEFGAQVCRHPIAVGAEFRQLFVAKVGKQPVWEATEGFLRCAACVGQIRELNTLVLLVRTALNQAVGLELRKRLIERRHAYAQDVRHLLRGYAVLKLQKRKNASAAAGCVGQGTALRHTAMANDPHELLHVHELVQRFAGFVDWLSPRFHIDCLSACALVVFNSGDRFGIVRHRFLLNGA